MEKCEGDLSSYIRNERKARRLDIKLCPDRTYTMIKHLAKEILFVLLHLVFVKGIHHRDVKPKNFLYYHDEAGVIRLKVCDFGLAKIFSQGQEGQSVSTVGTRPYMAPEIIDRHGVKTNSDLYSFAVLIYEMIFGKIPENIDVAVAQIPDVENVEIRELLEKLFQPYQTRMSWEEVLFHPFIIDPNDLDLARALDLSNTLKVCNQQIKEERVALDRRRNLKEVMQRELAYNGLVNDSALLNDPLNMDGKNITSSGNRMLGLMKLQIEQVKRKAEVDKIERQRKLEEHKEILRIKQERQRQLELGNSVLREGIASSELQIGKLIEFLTQNGVEVPDDIRNPYKPV